MIITKFLGIIDIITAVLFWLSAFFHIISQTLLIFFTILLLVKGISFLLSHDIASIGDVICSCIILFSLSVSIYPAITIITSLYLIQKGVFSFL